MVDHVEKIVNELGLPYRILRLCGGDLGLRLHAYDFDYFQHKINGWKLVRFQLKNFAIRRLKIKYKSKME